MKRYLCFICAQYYPSGGMDDLIGDFETLDEALAFLIKAIENLKVEQDKNTEEIWEDNDFYVYDLNERCRIIPKKK